MDCKWFLEVMVFQGLLALETGLPEGSEAGLLAQ